MDLLEWFVLVYITCFKYRCPYLVRQLLDWGGQQKGGIRGFCKYDWEWYYKVTLRIKPNKKRKALFILKRDKECVGLLKKK